MFFGVKKGLNKLRQGPHLELRGRTASPRKCQLVFWRGVGFCRLSKRQKGLSKFGAWLCVRATSDSDLPRTRDPRSIDPTSRTT